MWSNIGGSFAEANKHSVSIPITDISHVCHYTVSVVFSMPLLMEPENNCYNTITPLSHRSIIVNILIVDNNEPLRSFCRTVLDLEGHTVHTVDEPTYWERYKGVTGYIDLAIVNLHPVEYTPAVNVVDSLIIGNPNIHVMVLSVDWCCEPLKELINKGCMHLTVPFEAEELIKKVNSLPSFSFMLR